MRKLTTILFLLLTTAIFGQQHGMMTLAGQGGVDLKTGLVFALELDDASGSTANDSHNSYDGTSYNVTVNQSGKINKAYDFLGTNGGGYARIEMGDNDAFTPNQAFSWSCWLNLDYLGEPYALKYLFFKQYEYYVRVGSTGIVQVTLYHNGTSTFTTTYTTDNVVTASQWDHIVVTYDGSTNNSGINIFVNGDKKALTYDYSANHPTIANTANALYIGTNTGQWFEGLVDQVLFYNIDLYDSSDDTKIQALYNSGNGLAYSNW